MSQALGQSSCPVRSRGARAMGACKQLGVHLCTCARVQGPCSSWATSTCWWWLWVTRTLRCQRRSWRGGWDVCLCVAPEDSVSSAEPSPKSFASTNSSLRDVLTPRGLQHDPVGLITPLRRSGGRKHFPKSGSEPKCPRSNAWGSAEGLQGRWVGMGQF